MTTTYVDYSIFTNDKFDPRLYANQLLLSTNDKDDQHIDFTSAENKLKFDLDEVATAVKSEVESNWEDLLERTELSAATLEDVLAIENTLKSLSSAFERLETKSVVPYQSAEPLHAALLNLSSTTALLRALIRYLDIYSRVDTLKGFTACTEFLMDIDRCVAENRGLMQLRIVISNLPRLDSIKSQSLRDCTTAITTYTNVGLAMTCLNHLDPALLLKTFKGTIQKILDEAVKILRQGFEVTTSIRRLQASDNARAVTAFVENLKAAFTGMRKCANQVEGLDLDVPPELHQHILDDAFDGSSNLKQYFWREVSGRISRVTRDVCRSDQWVLRTLRGADIASIVVCGLSQGTMEYSVVYGSLSRSVSM